MYENNIPVLCASPTDAQTALIRAVKSIYIEYTGDSTQLAPTLFADIDNSGELVGATISLQGGSNTDIVDLLSADISVNGDIYEIECSSSDVYCYLELRKDKQVNSSIELAPSVVYIKPAYGGAITTEISVESPLELSVVGSSIAINLDYIGLESFTKQATDSIVSINGLMPDENGNINIKSYTDSVLVGVN